MFLVDIAVPRDIDPRIADIPGAYVYDIDDLQQVVQGNRENREKESEQARTLLAEEEKTFLLWLKSLESVPLIRGIQQQGESIRQDELLKAQRYLKDLSPEQQEAVERFSRSLMKRFLHPSLRSLKSLPEDMEGDLLMGAARKLFGVELKPVETSSATQHKESDEHTSG
jgi:glutamyl-tRNA reductase